MLLLGVVYVREEVVVIFRLEVDDEDVDVIIVDNRDVVE